MCNEQKCCDRLINSLVISFGIALFMCVFSFFYFIIVPYQVATNNHTSDMEIVTDKLIIPTNDYTLECNQPHGSVDQVKNCAEYIINLQKLQTDSSYNCVQDNYICQMNIVGSYGLEYYLTLTNYPTVHYTRKYYQCYIFEYCQDDYYEQCLCVLNNVSDTRAASRVYFDKTNILDTVQYQDKPPKLNVEITIFFTAFSIGLIIANIVLWKSFICNSDNQEIHIVPQTSSIELVSRTIVPRSNSNTENSKSADNTSINDTSANNELPEDI